MEALGMSLIATFRFFQESCINRANIYKIYNNSIQMTIFLIQQYLILGLVQEMSCFCIFLDTVFDDFLNPRRLCTTTLLAMNS